MYELKIRLYQRLDPTCIMNYQYQLKSHDLRILIKSTILFFWIKKKKSLTTYPYATHYSTIKI